jgi:dethiobiotin synthetase
MRTWFVTGTDTEIGKTFAACDLVRYLVAQGQRVAVAKPVASGCEQTAAGLRNEDALALQAASNVRVPYELINPYRFEPPIAPHLAAAAVGEVIDLQLATRIQREVEADWLVVEGAGGWNVPLDDQRMLRELAGAFTSSVLLVVGMRLGCINHALLSAEQIRRDGFELVGWVANHVDPDMLEQRGNLATLDRLMPAPRIGTIPFVRAMDGPWQGDWRFS